MQLYKLCNVVGLLYSPSAKLSDEIPAPRTIYQHTIHLLLMNCHTFILSFSVLPISIVFPFWNAKDFLMNVFVFNLSVLSLSVAEGSVQRPNTRIKS